MCVNHNNLIISVTYPFTAAHARLMLRKEVSVQDAVVAVSAMESSMQVTAFYYNASE